MFSKLGRRILRLDKILPLSSNLDKTSPIHLLGLKIGILFNFNLACP
jgi:hypothetical protein